jgi:hypothetical protein
MGTRGLIGFRSKDKDYLTYNHFDSYPESLGVSILEELEAMDLDKLKKAVNKLVLVNEDSKPTFEQRLDIAKEFWDLSVGDQTPESWYCLMRNAQGQLMPYYSGKLKYMIDSHNFILDSLFCEWAYIVNLDTMKLEVWRGFQKEPQEGSRYVKDKTKDKLVAAKILPEEYYPCALVKEYPLKKLPSKEKFLKDLEEKEDE